MVIIWETTIFNHTYMTCVSPPCFLKWSCDFVACLEKNQNRTCAILTRSCTKNNSGTEPVKIRDAWLNFNLFLQEKAQSMPWWMGLFFFHVSAAASFPGNPPCIDSKKRQHDPPIFHWWKGWLHPKRHWTCPGGCVKGTNNFELWFFENQLLQRIGQVPIKWGHLRCFTHSLKTIHSMQLVAVDMWIGGTLSQFSGCFIKFPMTRYNTLWQGSKNSDKNQIGSAHASQCFG